MSYDELVQLIEEFVYSIRSAWYVAGTPPVQVTSWYRDPEHNRRVGGHPESQHQLALAMDLTGPELETFAQAARDQGLIAIEYPTYVHVQRFPAGHVASEYGLTFDA